MQYLLARLVVHVAARGGVRQFYHTRQSLLVMRTFARQFVIVSQNDGIADVATSTVSALFMKGHLRIHEVRDRRRSQLRFLLLFLLTTRPQLNANDRLIIIIGIVQAENTQEMLQIFGLTNCREKSKTIFDI